MNEYEEQLLTKPVYKARIDVLIYRIKNKLDYTMPKEYRKYIDANLKLMYTSLKSK